MISGSAVGWLRRGAQIVFVGVWPSGLTLFCTKKAKCRMTPTHSDHQQRPCFREGSTAFADGLKPAVPTFLLFKDQEVLMYIPMHAFILDFVPVPGLCKNRNFRTTTKLHYTRAVIALVVTDRYLGITSHLAIV